MTKNKNYTIKSNSKNAHIHLIEEDYVKLFSKIVNDPVFMFVDVAEQGIDKIKLAYEKGVDVPASKLSDSVNKHYTKNETTFDGSHSRIDAMVSNYFPKNEFA